ncbi:FolC bifunctional protein [Xylariaceae sp. FL0804]|nr:FolC bifunctional protein [Xylariaceae sp. FL0804]
MAAPSPRTYEAALARLAQLQSNKAVVSRFGAAGAPAQADINAGAIPEMLAWVRRAGLDLAAPGDGGGGGGTGSHTGTDTGTTTTTPPPLLRCIHVAGTKGKGSVCAYLTALLLATPATREVAGRVGTYTSPHLMSVRERIQIDGAPVSREAFARYFFEVWDALTAAARAERQKTTTTTTTTATTTTTTGGGEGAAGEVSEETEAEAELLEGPATKPFYFRFLTLLALHAFAREGVRSAVVECGIGGEHDSTNVLPAANVTAAVVTQLGVDHVGMLGGTRPEIAWHKAGICKRGRKCFTRRLRARGRGRGRGEKEEEEGKEEKGEEGEEGEEGERTMQVLRRRAAERGAVLVEVEDDEVERWGGVEGAGGSLEGDFQKYNQALAVGAAMEHLRVLQGLPDSDGEPPASFLRRVPEGFARGLRAARLRGRCETRADGHITWLIDGAHTAESLEEVAKWFAAKISTSSSSSPSSSSSSTSPHDKAKARKVLLFNQQDRDAAKLLGGFLEALRRRCPAGVPLESLFELAVFSTNELESSSSSTSLPSSSTDQPARRDLSVQEAAAAAWRSLCPRTPALVVDNVGDAVRKIREMAASKEEEGEAIPVVVLATGSLYLVGSLLRTLEPESEL